MQTTVAPFAATGSGRAQAFNSPPLARDAPLDGVPSGLQRKAPLSAGLRIKGGRRSSYWGRAILHKAIAAIEVDMLYALIAAAHRTGTSLPFPRATRLRGIHLTRNV